MNVMSSHHLNYAKGYHYLAVSGEKNVDKKYCEQKMWENLLLWAMYKDLG